MKTFLESRHTNSESNVKLLSIFVFLPAVLDVEKWRRDFAIGMVPDESPYGYHHAVAEGFDLSFSKPFKSKTIVEKFLCRISNKLFKFDIVHAWRNRKSMFASDVIWTHTEHEHLAVELLAFVLQKKINLIAQSVWLIDEWPNLSALHRRFYQFLMQRAGVLTFLSKNNLNVAEKIMPGKDSRLIPFGISFDSFPAIAISSIIFHLPLRVLVLGNDRHRDWLTLFNAFAGKSTFEVKIASQTFPKTLRADNFSLVHASQKELINLYSWADIIIIPLTENLHASGITVILEAVALGVPCIATDTGGLKDYFSNQEITYVPSGDAGALFDAAMNLKANPKQAWEMAMRAQKHLQFKNYSSKKYTQMHCTISRELIALNPSENLEKIQAR